MNSKVKLQMDIEGEEEIIEIDANDLSLEDLDDQGEDKENQQEAINNNQIEI